MCERSRVEALAGASLDQTRDEKPIDRTLRLLLADQLMELLSVGARLQAAKANAAAGKQLQHLPEVEQLLLRRSLPGP